MIILSFFKSFFIFVPLFLSLLHLVRFCISGYSSFCGAGGGGAQGKACSSLRTLLWCPLVSLLCHRPTIYIWKKKDGELPPLAKPDGAFLRFEMLNKSDNGVYLCQADNGIGNSQGEYALLVQGNKKKKQKEGSKDRKRDVWWGRERLM